MTSDDADATAVDWRPETGPRGRPTAARLIKPDDGRLRQRYMGPAYPHTPAAATPQRRWRERQVASALRNSTTFATVSLTDGADGTARRAAVVLPLCRPAALAAPAHLLQRLPRRAARGSG
jgi:hypothetical protein